MEQTPARPEGRGGGRPGVPGRCGGRNFHGPSPEFPHHSDHHLNGPGFYGVSIFLQHLRAGGRFRRIYPELPSGGDGGGCPPGESESVCAGVERGRGGFPDFGTSKFGFQRVSDIACRFVREGKLTRDQAMQYIRDRDYQLDPAAKDDFCRTVGLTEKEFDKTVAVHANHEIVVCDVNNIWRRRDLVD